MYLESEFEGAFGLIATVASTNGALWVWCEPDEGHTEPVSRLDQFSKVLDSAAKAVIDREIQFKEWLKTLSREELEDQLLRWKRLQEQGAKEHRRFRDLLDGAK